jgi:hypothetical protein
MPSSVLNTQALSIPAGTTGERPSATVGMIRYNTTKGYTEVYDSLGVWRPLQGVLYAHHFEDATRNIGLPQTNASVVISFTFEKKFADSYLVMRGVTPVSGQYSYQAGEYAEIASVRKYEAAHYVCPPDSMGDDEIYGTVNWNGVWTSVSTTGTKTVNLGWNVRSGSTGEHPGNYWNPDTRGGRARARTTVIDIFEIDPSVMAIIT